MNSNRKTKPLTFLSGKFVHLERHEVLVVAWSFACFFCILSSYYILRPVRDAMAVSSGTDTIPYLFLATFITTLLTAPVFGWIASRYPRRVFLPWVFLFFVSNILIFWAAFSNTVGAQNEIVWLGRAFFVWTSVFNLFVVSVFWSFMADVYTREQGRRLFGIISAGGSIGALLGGVITSAVVKNIGFHNLLPISAALLFLAIFCIGAIRRWVATEYHDTIVDTVESTKPLGGTALSGITHVFSSKYFLAIAVSSVVANLLGTSLYLFTASLLEQTGTDANEHTFFFSNINVATNGLSIFGQFFLLKYVVNRFGIGFSLAVMPILTVVGFVILAIEPTLLVIAIFTATRRGVGFSFAKPSTDMLYSVVTPEEKYKTKNFIDTSVYRAGDVISSWSLKPILGLGIPMVSAIMLPFALVWATIAFWLGRDYRRQAIELRESGIK